MPRKLHLEYLTVTGVAGTVLLLLVSALLGYVSAISIIELWGREPFELVRRLRADMPAFVVIAGCVVGLFAAALLGWQALRYLFRAATGRLPRLPQRGGPRS